MFKAFKKSWKNLRLILFIPDLLMLMIATILGFVFLETTGIYSSLTNTNIVVESMATFLPILKDYILTNWFKLIVYAGIFFLTNFFIGSGLMSVKYSMIRSIILKKRIPMSFSKIYEYEKKFFWKVVCLRIWVYLIGLIFILFIGAFYILISLLNKSYALILSGIVFFIVLILLNLLLFFRYPALFLDTKSSFKAIKDSITYFRKNSLRVITVLFIIFLVGAGFTLIAMVLDGLVRVIGGVFGFLSFVTAINILIRLLFNLVVKLWGDVLKFFVYESK
jgi:hypothetical protein